MTIEQLLREPLFFDANRVSRVYTGGALFADFFGDDSVDGFEPEEWIASSVAALNKESKGVKEGVSRIENTDLYFDDLLRLNPKQLLGDRSTFGVLTKVLDSAIRLPVQAHPDKAFSRQFFHSDYGKAESWVVLATRPGAKLYFGFNHEITKEEFIAAIDASETDGTVMESLLNVVPVQAGDVYFVPAKMVHAIGYGCLILEIQEPTDFTIQPEHWCGDYHLNKQEMYIGLEQDVALDVFDYSLYGDAAVAKGRKTPQVLSDQDGHKTEQLIRYEDTPCFAVQQHTLTNTQATLTNAPAVYVVTEGTGELRYSNKVRPMKKGDTFFLPYAANHQVSIATNQMIQVVECLPPQKLTQSI